MDEEEDFFLSDAEDDDMMGDMDDDMMHVSEHTLGIACELWKPLLPFFVLIALPLWRCNRFLVPNFLGVL